MKTVELIREAGSDKIVHLAIPVDEAARRYRLIVLIEPDSDDEGGGLDEWPPGFFERTAGKWVGELERAPQGEYERREQL